jgi:UDP-N-acetylmuramyl pentapeptide synthase
MDGLCSGDLASITGGRLNLGTLPPLGGEWEPVTRIITDSQMVCRGDVFWDVIASPGEPGSSAEEAFARGAVGVVSSRSTLEPWGGAFVVKVRDAYQALLNLGCWARRRHHGQVFAVTSRRRSPLPRILQLLSGREVPFADYPSSRAVRSDAFNGSEVSVSELTSVSLKSTVELALHLIHQAPTSLTTVIPFDSEEIQDFLAISDLCCPHVAVITSSPCGDQLRSAEVTKSWLDSLPTGGCAVLIGSATDEPKAWDAGSGVQVVRVGTTEGCDWRIKRVQRQGSLTLLETNHGYLTWSLWPEWPVTEVVAAYVASQIMGVHRKEFAEACESLSEQTSAAGAVSPAIISMEDSPFQSLKCQSKKSKVPPLVSGLRESDTALPPGLKRFAC